MPSSTNSSKSSGTASVATASGEKPPAFEEALRQLEEIVESMESGDLPLETLLARFEQGTRLVQACQSRLEEAEVKIARLEKDRGGEFALQPLQPVVEVEAP